MWDNLTGDLMRSSDRSSLHTISFVFLFLGAVLVLLNLIGYYHYKSVTVKDPQLLDDSPTTISEEEFWQNAYRKTNEPLGLYLQRLTELVSKRTLLIDSKYTKPTIFENWILWVYSHYMGYYEWINTKKAVRLGGGYCSQHAIIFNNILREQKIQSRILELGGHVLNEVLVDREWNVYDPDYNVVFNASLKELENDPEQVYQAYARVGRPEDEAKHWQNVFATDADNWHYKKTRTYRDEKYYIEAAALYLVWVIPVILIVLGIGIRKRCVA
jgi:predicted membrane protein